MSQGFGAYYERVWRTKLGLDKYQSLDTRWRTRWEFALEHIRERSIVIDAGCGDGVLGEFLIRDKSCTVHGLDVAPYALSIATQRGVQTSECDISSDNFPYPNETFDAAVMSCTLEHILNPIHTLQESMRVLKHGGIAIVTLPNVVYLPNRLWFLLGVTSKELLHTNPGEGAHLQFFNYRNEFEERVLTHAPEFRIELKRGDLKNSKKYRQPLRGVMKFLARTMPNLFAQYTHWLLKKT